MSLTGDRRESARFELLTAGERLIGELDGVVRGSGSITLNANADLRAGGGFTLDDTGQEIAWGSDRVRVWWDIEGEDSIPLGVFVIAVSGFSWLRDGRRQWSVELVDKLTIPDEQVVGQTWTVAAGSNIIEAAITALSLTGETRIAATPSAAVLASDMVWSPTTSVLRVVNDLLDAAGYWSLWTDAAGQFRMEPYVKPGERPVVWAFEPGAAAVHQPDWSLSSDLSSVPNRVILTSQADDDGAVMTATAQDDDPDSPTGFVARGRWVDYVEENVEAADLAALQARADRLLIEKSEAAASFESVKHAILPLWYNQAVSFTSHGSTALATITSMDIPLTPGGQVTAKWRRV